MSGDVFGREGVIAALRIGPYELRDIPVAVAPAAVRSKQPGADGVLGCGALQRFHLVFDYARERLYLRPNLRFSEPFARPPRDAAPPAPRAAAGTKPPHRSSEDWLRTW